MRNRINLHTARDESILGTLKYVSKTEEHQVYGALIPKEMLNEDPLKSTAYQTYNAYASAAKEPKKARKFKKPASLKLKTIPVSPKEPTKKPAKGKKDVSQTRKPSTKPKPTKKKAPVKADRGKGDGTDFKSGVLDEQQCRISGTDEGTGTKPGVPDVPKYDSKSEKESWGDSGEEEDDDDDDDDSEDESDDDNNDDNDDERTESDSDENPNLNQSNEEHEEEEEYADERVHNPENYELTDEDNVDNAKEENEEEKDDVKELYKDVNVNLRKEDVEMTDADQDKLLNFENTSPTDNEIASLMDTTVCHEEPSSQTSSLFTVPVMVIPEITSAFTTTIPPPPPSFNPFPQQATPTPTPTTL
ncbi:hypothetical protein Tco_1150892 [Tanacetum coccineum]